MVKARPVRLIAHARLLPDPPLWCWEIVDPSSGAVVASSWESEWTAYPSSDEALRQATPALVAMSRQRGGAAARMLEEHDHRERRGA